MIPSRYKLSLPIPVDCISLSESLDALMRVAKPNVYVLSEDALDVHRRLRTAFAAGELEGLITAPNDERLKLRASGWELPPSEAGNPGFLDDYVGPGLPCRHGPDTTLGTGKYRPVYLVRAEFRLWLHRNWPSAGRLRGIGRRHGSGTYQKQDQPLIDEMHELITSGKAKSPNEAAGMVADKAQGASRPSKISRLGKAYRSKQNSN
jgi:hypothetical protein